MASDPSVVVLPADASAASENAIPQGFAARYRQLLVYKSADVEEPIDLYFHRPLAAAFASLIVGSRITPNQVTYASLIVGLGSSAFLYRVAFLDGGSWNYAVAGLLFFASVILDCADGQIARARGGGTRMGRILDGLVDMLVLLPAWVLLGVAWMKKNGAIWLPLGLAAGLTSWARIVIYDRIKSIYLAHTNPSSSNGTESSEALEAELAEIRSHGFSFDYIGMFIYVRVLMRIQNRIAPGVTHERELSPDAREAYRNRHRSTMRWCSWLGLGTHAVFLYVAMILATWFSHAVTAVHILFVSVFTLLMIAVLVRSRALRAE